jgi:hypothetical protein
LVFEAHRSFDRKGQADVVGHRGRQSQALCGGMLGLEVANLSRILCVDICGKPSERTVTVHRRDSLFDLVDGLLVCLGVGRSYFRFVAADQLLIDQPVLGRSARAGT